MNAYTFWKELDGLTGSLANPAITPRVDVVEAKDHYELIVELPGFRTEEVTVQVKDGVLELNAQKAKAEESGDQQWLLKERRSAPYQRSFRLPRDVDGDNIDAKFQDGLLVLTLPKKEEAKPRTVNIKAA